MEKRWHLVQLLLPLRDNDGDTFAQELLQGVLDELYERFGGSTAYTRSPAEGLWKSGGADHRDDIIVVEVMVAAFDPGWWRKYRQELEKRFRQKELIVRAQPIERL
jgi:hypothetical protein